MEEAIKILKERGYTLPPEKKGDIDPAGERILGQYVKETYGHDFLFLTDWPISVRPFYHMRYPDRPGITKSFDLIAHGLEITTGAQREHRYEILKQQALEKGLHLEPIQFYLDFFRYGCPPHGGFGFGLSPLPDGAAGRAEYSRDGVLVQRSHAADAVRGNPSTRPTIVIVGRG